MSKGSAVVVGAGVAGLTAAWQLAREGWEITVVEIEETVGGLTRSFYYGDHIFDIGPHRFHTDDAKVLAFIEDVLGDDKILIDRSSAVFLKGRYLGWPLSAGTVFKLPFGMMVGAFFDLFLRRKPKDESFEQYILSRYGRTLYLHFFKYFTEKFLKYPCDKLHYDWASSGIDRAVIDKSYKADSLFSIIKSTLLPKPVQAKFIYPAYGGVDTFCKKIADRIEKKGGRLLTSSRVVEVAAGGRKITGLRVDAAGREESLQPDLTIWTAPITEIGRLLGLAPWGLEFLSVIIFNYSIEGKALLPYQWTYYGEKELIFNRASIPANFAPHTAPEGQSGICIELACMEGDGVWHEPEHLRSLVERDMMRTGMIRRYNDIIDLHLERIRNTYPIYSIDYRDKLQSALEGLDRYENLLLLGRTGTFWYNNMDHSVRQALDLAEILNREGDLDAHRRGVRENRAL